MAVLPIEGGGFSATGKGPSPLRGESRGEGDTKFRKIPVSLKFVSAILGPEMAAPILWTPGKNAFFLQENPCP